MGIRIALAVLGIFQTLFGTLSWLAFSGYYGPSWWVLFLGFLLGVGGPLLLAIGALAYQPVGRPRAWRAMLAGTTLFVIYGVVQIYAGVRNWAAGNDTNLGLVFTLLWAALPLFAIWGTWKLWRKRVLASAGTVLL